MADLTASNVTVTINKKTIIPRWRMNKVTIAFGNGALTYPANGVPMPAKLRFGMAKGIIDLMLLQPPPGDGLVYKYDPTNHTVRMWQSAAHTHDVKLIGGITATEPVAVQGGDTLGKNAATDRTIAGANSATKGGVVAAAVAALAEFSGAPAATSLVAIVIGS